MVVQGKVDDLRLQRRNFYILYCLQTEKPLDIKEVFPLAFDDELKEQEPEISDWQLYIIAKESGYFQNPLN